MFNEIFNNRGNKVDFKYDGSKNPYVAFKKFYEENKDTLKDNTIVVRGVWVNYKSVYGASPCIVTDGVNLNVPEYLIKDIEAIRADPRLVQAINDGRCGFKFKFYTDRNGIERLGGNFCDYEI